MVVAQWLIDLLFAGGFLFTGFKIGVYWQQSKSEEIVSDTIDWLINAGYLKTRIREDGDIDLIQLNEKD